MLNVYPLPSHVCHVHQFIYYLLILYHSRLFPSCVEITPIQGRPEGMSWEGVSPSPTNENISRQSKLFHYRLKKPNFTYGKKILHIS
jgi:hypothetical protein